jgi:hypothetical protein
MKTFRHPEYSCLYADIDYVLTEMKEYNGGLFSKFNGNRIILSDKQVSLIDNVITNVNRSGNYFSTNDFSVKLSNNHKRCYVLSESLKIGIIIDLVNSSGVVIDDIYLVILSSVHFIESTFDYIEELKNKTIDPTLKKRYDNIDGELFVSFIEQNYIKRMTDILRLESYKMKRETKKAAKLLVKYKYKIGDWYSVRYRQLDNTEINKDIYEVKKVIHSIGSTIVNVLIMKKISDGTSMQDMGRNILTHHDCKMFHIKYEPGLLVFNMNEKLYKVNKDKK